MRVDITNVKNENKQDVISKAQREKRIINQNHKFEQTIFSDEKKFFRPTRWFEVICKKSLESNK